ncbi:MAG: DUF61 family protein [Methanobacteriota archaeon]
MDGWVAFELGRLNAGLVTEKKSLAGLRTEARPACRTRQGGEHAFDRDALDRLAAVCAPDEAEALRLPITVFASGDLEDTAYVSDALAAKALRAIEGFGAAFPFRDGRMHLPHSLAIDLVRRSGGTIQVAFA